MRNKEIEFLRNKKEIERLTKLNESLETDILEYMENSGITTLTLPNGTITRIEESTSFRFNTARFKENNFEEYQNNLIETTRKAHLVTKTSK